MAAKKKHEAVGDIHRVEVKFRRQGDGEFSEDDYKTDIMPEGFPLRQAEFDLPVLADGWTIVPSGAFTNTLNRQTGASGIVVVFNIYDDTGKKRGSYQATAGGEA